MSEEMVNEQPVDQTQEPVAPAVSSAPETSVNTESAQAAGTGMLSSVLKPQTDEERKNMERAREKQSGRKLPGGIILGIVILVILVVAVAAVFKSGVAQRMKNKTERMFVQKKKAVQPEVFSHKVNVSGATTFITVIVPKDADKVTGVFARQGAPKTITKTGVKKQTVSQGASWELSATQLRKGQYSYKVFVHDPAYPDVALVTGNFVVK